MFTWLTTKTKWQLKRFQHPINTTETTVKCFLTKCPYSETISYVYKIPVCLLNSTELIDNSGNWKCKMQIRECTSDLIFIYPFPFLSHPGIERSSISPPILNRPGWDMQNRYKAERTHRSVHASIRWTPAQHPVLCVGTT